MVYYFTFWNFSEKKLFKKKILLDLIFLISWQASSWTYQKALSYLTIKLKFKINWRKYCEKINIDTINFENQSEKINIDKINWKKHLEKINIDTTIWEKHSEQINIKFVTVEELFQKFFSTQSHICIEQYDANAMGE